jgi:hypothetical protein
MLRDKDGYAAPDSDGQASAGYARLPKRLIAHGQ